MEKCQHCGWRLGDIDKAGRYEFFCDSVLTLGTDPFAEEIRGDHTEVWMCYGARCDSAMEI